MTIEPRSVIHWLCVIAAIVAAVFVLLIGTGPTPNAHSETVAIFVALLALAIGEVV
jgi:uncharacterized membrane protein YgaE (UPF0421/DUF939 family)